MASLFTLYWGFKKIQLKLHTYVLAKMLQNVAKFLQKLTPGFKNRMNNLDNFKQVVESPKSWNLMGYFCLKDTFLQLKHYIQRIYLTLLSTTCVKIHQMTFYENSPSKRKFSNFSLLALKFTKFLMAFSNKKSVFLQSLDLFSASWQTFLL